MAKSKTVCAVDAILPPDKAFQMTISPKHALKAKGVNTIPQWMNSDPLKFYNLMITQENNSMRVVTLQVMLKDL